MPARDTRAKLGINAIPMATISDDVPTPTTDPAMIASRRAGNASAKSDSRMMKESSHPPRTAASIPSGTPTPAPIATARTLTSREIWDPTIIRDSVSRPYRSVPIQWSQLGGCSADVGLASCGPYGVQISETNATRTTRLTTTAPTMNMTRWLARVTAFRRRLFPAITGFGLPERGACVRVLDKA